MSKSWIAGLYSHTAACIRRSGSTALALSAVLFATTPSAGVIDLDLIGESITGSFFQPQTNPIEFFNQTTAVVGSGSEFDANVGLFDFNVDFQDTSVLIRAENNSGKNLFFPGASMLFSGLDGTFTDSQNSVVPGRLLGAAANPGNTLSFDNLTFNNDNLALELPGFILSSTSAPLELEISLEREPTFNQLIENSISDLSEITYMKSVFTPNFGVSLDDAARHPALAKPYEHFNWVNLITRDDLVEQCLTSGDNNPCKDLLTKDEKLPTTLDTFLGGIVAYNDPPAGGYAYLGNFPNQDSLPWYWDEVYGLPNIVGTPVIDSAIITKEDTLLFFDAPKTPVGEVHFTTMLAGVYADGTGNIFNSIPDTMFRWSYNNATDSVARRYADLSQPGSGTASFLGFTDYSNLTIAEQRALEQAGIGLHDKASNPVKFNIVTIETQPDNTLFPHFGSLVIDESLLTSNTFIEAADINSFDIRVRGESFDKDDILTPEDQGFGAMGFVTGDTGKDLKFGTTLPGSSVNLINSNGMLLGFRPGEVYALVGPSGFLNGGTLSINEDYLRVPYPVGTFDPITCTLGNCTLADFGWISVGDGSANLVEILPGSGDLVASLTTGSPIGIAASISTPDTPFELTYDYLFGTSTGLLEVFLDSILIDTLSAMVGTEFQMRSILVDDLALLGLDNASIYFRFDGVTGSQVFLDNISISAVDEPSIIPLIFLGLLMAGLSRRRRNCRPV